MKEMIIKYCDSDEQAALRESLSKVHLSMNITTPTRHMLALDSRPGGDPVLYKK